MLRHPYNFLALLTLAVIALVGLSPLAIAPLALLLSSSTLERGSLIGQTYGAVAAVVSSLALIGIGVSLFLQQRESRSSRAHNLRLRHIELLRLALDDEELLRAWGPFIDGDETQRRQHLYVNLIVSQWQMAYKLNELGDIELRAMTRELLRGDPGRRYWDAARVFRLATQTSPQDVRFHSLVEEEWQRALTILQQGDSPSWRSGHRAGMGESDSNPHTPDAH